MSEELIKRLHYLQGVADGIEARKSLRGFYVPQDTTDLLEAITRAADQVNTDTVSVPTVPTDAMRDAGNEIIKNRSQLFQAWNAMLRAAQEGKK